MSVVIRLRRPGKRANKRHNFKVVVCNDAVSRDGRFIEEIGYYDSTKKEIMFKIDKDRLKVWVEKGAIVSDTVKSLIKKAKI